MNEQEQEELIPLTESGETAWNHRVSIHDGCLTLTWQENGKEKLRTFTNEETLTLFLYGCTF